MDPDTVRDLGDTARLREQAERRRVEREQRSVDAAERAKAIREIRDGAPRAPVDRRQVLLDLLADGEWHSADELASVARFASDWIALLRDDGYSIEARADSYRLAGTPTEAS